MKNEHGYEGDCRRSKVTFQRRLSLLPPPSGRLLVLMMKAVRTSETSVYFYETTRRYITEGCHRHILKSQWNVAPYNLVNIDRSFRGDCLYHGAGVAQAV
jgi:hypothetical protein